MKAGLNVGHYTRIQGGIEGCTYPITLRSSDSERKRHREQLWRLYQKGNFIVEICTLRAVDIDVRRSLRLLHPHGPCGALAEWRV